MTYPLKQGVGSNLKNIIIVLENLFEHLQNNNKILNKTKLDVTLKERYDDRSSLFFIMLIKLSQVPVTTHIAGN